MSPIDCLHLSCVVLRCKFLDPGRAFRYYPPLKACQGQIQVQMGLRRRYSPPPPKSKSTTVTITNPSHDQPVSARLRLTGGNMLEARGTVLSHASMTARNTFEKPDEVKLLPLSVADSGNSTQLSIPARSIVALSLRLS